jgi:Ca2+-binding RTX toxin-like protein
VSRALGANLENLTLTEPWAIDGTGNAGTNVISGNLAANVITGGAGADTLRGGEGADSFRFVLPDDGVDTLVDFTSGEDKIVVVAGNFGLLAGSTANLVVNGIPSSGAAVFLYTSATGSLAFDADGNGPGAAVPLALLSNKPPTLAPADIVLGP